jgi:hypothetical protein
MSGAVVATAWAAAAINAAAGIWGAWRWWRVEPSAAFWVLLRTGQAATVVFAVVCGIAAIGGHTPDDGLFWLYVALPIAVAFVAEQLRILSAQSVLEARGLPDAQAVGRLDDAGQRSVVLAIVRREMGVMTAEALAVAFLLGRAALTSGGI